MVSLVSPGLLLFSKQNQHIYSELLSVVMNLISNDNLEYDFNLSDVITNAVT